LLLKGIITHLKKTGSAKASLNRDFDQTRHIYFAGICVGGI
jgi:hypothetical protein